MTDAVRRPDVVLVAGPWLAGVSALLAALRQRLPGHALGESADLPPGDAPRVVLFVVSAAAPMTRSDCALLDAVAAATDAVIGVVSKIDVHRSWWAVLGVDRDTLAAHAPRYRQVPWVGVAAAPELGPQRVDEVITALCAQLADPDIDRRNGMRATEARLAERARIAELRTERGRIVREWRAAKSQRGIALRGQLQRARAELAYLAGDRCTVLRGELQTATATLTRRKLARFEAAARGRMAELVAEVAECTSGYLADMARELDVTGDGRPPMPPVAEPPVVAIPAPPLRSRRLETRLMRLWGAGFGLGVALTMSRLLAGLAPGVPAVGIAAGVGIGVALAGWVVVSRGLLHDRAVLDRWVGEATALLRSALQHLVVTRVLAAEVRLSAALSRRDDAERALIVDQIGKLGRISSELNRLGRPCEPLNTTPAHLLQLVRDNLC